MKISGVAFGEDILTVRKTRKLTAKAQEVLSFKFRDLDTSSFSPFLGEPMLSELIDAKK